MIDVIVERNKLKKYIYSVYNAKTKKLIDEVDSIHLFNLDTITHYKKWKGVYIKFNKRMIKYCDGDYLENIKSFYEMPIKAGFAILKEDGNLEVFNPYNHYSKTSLKLIEKDE